MKLRIRRFELHTDVHRHTPTAHAHRFSGDVSCFRAEQEENRVRDIRGLGQTPEGRLHSGEHPRFLRQVRDHVRRGHPRRDHVHTHAFRAVLDRQAPRERL